jgi:hypothetical protein
MFLYACESIVEICDKKTFEANFLPLLVRLSQDKVANVRLILSNLITTAQKRGFGSDDEEFCMIKLALECDKDLDVSYSVSSVSKK